MIEVAGVRVVVSRQVHGVLHSQYVRSLPGDDDALRLRIDYETRLDR